MVDFIADSLELLPQPAALYYASSLELVAGNAAAHQYVRDHLDPDVSEEDARNAFDLNRVLTKAQTLTVGTFSHHCSHGWLHATRLRATEGMSRPDLLLVTLHHGVDEKAAWTDHNRMVLSVRINENGEVALRALETMLVQAHAAVSAQRDMLASYNRQMREFLELNYPPRRSEKNRPDRA